MFKINVSESSTEVKFLKHRRRYAVCTLVKKTRCYQYYHLLTTYR